MSANANVARRLPLLSRMADDMDRQGSPRHSTAAAMDSAHAAHTAPTGWALVARRSGTGLASNVALDATDAAWSSVEEAHLRSPYGEPYTRYAERTPPLVGPELTFRRMTHTSIRKRSLRCWKDSHSYSH